MVALGVFDADRVTGQVRLRLTAGAEPFQALGAASPEDLAAGRLVLADDERVLSLFGHRDGVHQAVTVESWNVLVLGCVVEGVPQSAVVAAVRQTIRLISGE